MEKAANESESQSASDKPNPELVPGVLANDAFENVRLPPFSKNGPKTWFIQLESQFDEKDIRSNDAKLGIVLRHLDEQIKVDIVDVLEEPHESNKYERIKAVLIEKYSEALEKQLATVLGDIELGDKTPSALLQEMRTLVGTDVEDDMLRKLWLQRLHKRTQEQLVLLRDGTTLDQLAEFADMDVRAVVSQKLTSLYADTITKLTEQIRNLTDLVERRTAIAGKATSQKDAETIKRLTEEVDKLKGRMERVLLARDSALRENADTIKELRKKVDILERQIEKQSEVTRLASRKDANTIEDLKKEVDELMDRIKRLSVDKKPACHEHTATINKLTQQLKGLRCVLAKNKPDKHFQHVHLDLIGPLRDCQGYRYCVTMLDHCTGWPEAAPIEDASAEDVVRAFVTTWVSKFGTPTVITTSQKIQFKAKVFTNLTKLLGCTTIKSGEEENDIVNQWLCTFKRSLLCQLQEDDDWLTGLPIVLLGLRTAYKYDIRGSPAAKLYGKNLKLPGEFFENSPTLAESNSFEEDLTIAIRGIRPTLIEQCTDNVPFVHDKLHEATHVFVRDDSRNNSTVQRPYSGPHKILKNTNGKFYKVLINSKPHDVSIERLKPAFEEIIVDVSDSDAD